MIPVNGWTKLSFHGPTERARPALQQRLHRLAPWANADQVRVLRAIAEIQP